jgi:hypothetical protein
MRKEVEFSAAIDTEEFDRSIEQIKQKLKEVSPQELSRMQAQTSQRLQSMGMGGIMSTPTAEAFKRSTQQTKREMDQLISDHAKSQEKLNKEIFKQAESLKKLRDEQKQMVKDSKEELEIREKIARVESNHQQMKEMYRQRDEAINQAIDARDQSADGGGRGRGRGIGQRILDNFRSSPMGAIGTVLSGAGFALREGSEIFRDFSAGPIRTTQAMGNAVQGTMGNFASDIYGRRSVFEQAFAQERKLAAQQALERMRAERIADKVSMTGNLGMIGGGALMAASGNAIPVVGTAAGLIAGGVTAFKGASNLLGDERQRSLLLSKVSNTANQRYESILAEQLSKDFQASLEGQKKQNPFKTLAVQEYEQNFMRNLQFQRMMGMQNKQFYGPGGFQESIMGAGFTPEMGMEMAQGIVGAGGSTRMARESAFGLQLQRGANLTNAAQVLGTLSGGLGSSEATKNATIKILAEGMKLGLDDSKFAEENRKFVQMTAEIIAKSGAKTEEDFGRVSAGFGRFLGEETTLGLGAAKTAYEQYQQISQTTTGPRGVMRAAGMMGDKDLNKLTTITKQALMQVPEADLNENNPLVQAAAQEAGISPQAIVQKMTTVNQGAVSRFKEADSIRDRIRAGMKKLGKERLSEADIEKLPQDLRDDFNRLTAFQTTELGYQGQRETVARALGTINPAATAVETAASREEIRRKKISGETGRMEDETLKAMAADSKVVLENFRELAPQMEIAAKSTAAWTREMRQMNAELMQALQAKDTAGLQEILKKLSTMPTTQYQTGKQSK